MTLLEYYLKTSLTTLTAMGGLLIITNIGLVLCLFGLSGGWLIATALSGGAGLIYGINRVQDSTQLLSKDDTRPETKEKIIMWMNGALHTISWLFPVSAGAWVFVILWLQSNTGKNFIEIYTQNPNYSAMWFVILIKIITGIACGEMLRTFMQKRP